MCSRKLCCQLWSLFLLFDSMCGGNRYKTTIHAINSAIVKLSKISKAGGSLNGRMLLKIFIGWGVTIPLAMLVAIFFYAVIMPSYGYDDEQLRVLNKTVNATCF